eukprot:scaffold104833_cov72-Phaeocystis_antarctica.AAC.4
MAAAARAAAAVRAACAAAGVARRPAARGAQCMCTLRMHMHIQGAMFTCVPMSRCPDVPMSRCPDVPMSRCTQPMCMARAGRDRGHYPNPNPDPTPNVQGAVEAILAAPSRRDASVAPLPHTRGGPSAATARWRAYVRGGGLRSYASHRNNPLATAGKGGRRMPWAHRAAAWIHSAAAWIAAWIHRVAACLCRAAAWMRRVAVSTTTTTTSTHGCRR